MSTHSAGVVRCYVRDCPNPSSQNHHLTYRGERSLGDWALVPLCADCHEKLEALYEPVSDRLDRALFSMRFIMSPTAVEQRVRSLRKKLERAIPPAIDPQQLSFKDMMGRDGEYWRALWKDEVKDPDAPRHADRQQWRRAS